MTCWGYYTSAPATVAGLTTVRKVGVGSDHACAILDDGTVRCWGQNSSGQLGNGDAQLTSSTTPVTVVGVSGATALALGDSHACALMSNGQVRCWGANLDGQAGNASTFAYVLTGKRRSPASTTPPPSPPAPFTPAPCTRMAPRAAGAAGTMARSAVGRPPTGSLRLTRLHLVRCGRPRPDFPAGDRQGPGRDVAPPPCEAQRAGRCEDAVRPGFW